ncbi:hyphal wall protein 1, partial [Candida albicans P75016]
VPEMTPAGSQPSIPAGETSPAVPKSDVPATESAPAPEMTPAGTETKPAAPKSSAPATEPSPVAPGTESAPAGPGASSSPKSSVLASETSPIAPGAETAPAGSSGAITIPESSAVVSTTEGAIPTTLESVPLMQPSANYSSVAPISTFEGAGNNMRLTFGAAIIGIAAFLI